MTSSEHSAHKDIQPAQIKGSEADVHKLLQDFDNFVNPFKVENNRELYCLSSGPPAPETVANDLLNANARCTDVNKLRYDLFTKKFQAKSGLPLIW